MFCLTRSRLDRVASRCLQALGQCARFLVTHLPAAKLVKVSSTAAAAETISTQADDDDDDANSAAICSKICLQLFDNLEMLQESIQDSQREFNDLFWGSAVR